MKKILFILILTVFTAKADLLPTEVPQPADNKSNPDKIALGKQLYFDGRLSLNGKISCFTCHNPNRGGDDGKPTSTGINGQVGGRNSPTVLNAAFMSVQFWDGRAATLEEQAKGPITNPIEMGMPNHQALIDRLNKFPGYVATFEKVFGKDSVTIDNVARAIAAYERTLVTPNSPYDKFMAGNKKFLNKPAQKGLELVKSIGCTGCHSGPNFAGPNVGPGEGFYQKFPLIPGTEYERKYELGKDLGRYEVTKNEADKNMWRVPTWRNIRETAPYFHNGKVKDLPEAVRVMAKTQLGKDLTKEEVHDIVEFLFSLSGTVPLQKAPKLPPGKI